LFPQPLSELIGALNKLPGIGPRSAERIALFLVQSEAATVKNLANAIVAGRERIFQCSICGGLTSEQPCHICSDSRRDGSVICVVERPFDIFAIEKSGAFRGKFHVLGGKISPLNGIGPEDLRFGELVSRIGSEGTKEVIVALPSDVEGDATSYYLGKLLSTKGISVSRIAHGLPVGSGLEFADELTLSRAFQGRRPIE
jgi:recombination protein RecR